MAHTDLRELFAERAAVVPSGNVVERMHAVDRRVRAIRRRRTASASVGVVVLLLGVAAAVGLFGGVDKQASTVPAYQKKVAGGLLPRYNGGGEATSYTTFRTGEKRSTTFTFTPTAWTFLVGLSCDQDMPESEMISVAINGHPLMSGSCNSGVNTAGPAYGEERARAESLGITLGEPATVEAHVVRQVKGSSAAPEKLPVYRGVMGDYRVAVALYSPMPVDDYPFPPRPRKLEPLTGGGSFGGGRVLGAVDSRSVGANGTGTVVMTLPAKGIQTSVYAVAPGAVTVSVNGTVIDVSANWTWSGSGFGGLVLKAAALRKLGIHVSTGDRVTVAFTGERFAVAGWRAQVREGP